MSDFMLYVCEVCLFGLDDPCSFEGSQIQNPVDGEPGESFIPNATGKSSLFVCSKELLLLRSLQAIVSFQYFLMRNLLVNRMLVQLCQLLAIVTVSPSSNTACGFSISVSPASFPDFSPISATHDVPS